TALPLPTHLLDGVCISANSLAEHCRWGTRRYRLDSETANSSNDGKLYRLGWLLKAASLIDLTTLAGDDCPSNVVRLCHKARRPFAFAVLDKLEFEHGIDKDELHTAAVCLYPYQLAAAKSALDQIGASNRIRLACVATGFPSGQYGLESRLAEIRWAVEQGANEVDIVINRTLALQGRWSDVYEEVRAMREACGPSVCLKTILGVGELAAYETVYKASLVCMYAGADFIKTSTGKESVNATLPLSLVMLRAISEFHARTGRRVGFKPAGGIRTAADALDYLHLVQFALGPDWLQPNLLRIGASSLLGEIEKSAFRLLIGRDATAGDLPMA
ncbi:hypothetical protein BOX15_Mlig020924g16, partial [Macrostomum lignano]